MPYTVFALKWRPKNFDEIIGQSHITATLKSALEKKRLAHAYLFAGPRGVGKTSTARILAKALNCKQGPTLNPCDKCPSCLEIASSRSFDVIEIDGASNRGIDEIRVLRENVKFPPVTGKFKIYIIDEVHMLTTEAFNALLKTLEEPPEFVKFIFATTHPNKVLPTILSRCQRFDFRRIPILTIIVQLEKIVAEEKIGIDKEVLFAIAKSSDGSLRDAESLLDQLIAFSKEKVSLADVVSMLGVVEQEALFQITDRIIQKDAMGALELLNNIIDDGKDTGLFLMNLIEHFRNLMVAKITKADSNLIDLPQEICDRLLEQAKSLSLEEIFSAFNILINAQELSKRLDSMRIPLEIGLVRLAQVKLGISPNVPQKISPQPEKKIDTAKSAPLNKEVSSMQQPEPEGEQKKEESSRHISLDSIKGVWQNIIDVLSSIKMSVATYLNEGTPFKLEGMVLTVAFPKDYSLHKEALERKDNKAIIEKAVSEIANSSLRVNFILSKDVVKNSESADSPLLKSALEAFGARIIR